VFVSFAMPAAMLGVAWPDARREFDRPSSALGIVAAAYGLGRLATSASAGHLLKRFRAGSTIAAACVGLVVANLVVVAVPVWPVFVGTFAVIGLLSGVLDSMGGRYLATVRDVGGAGLMAGSYGAGATLGPAVVALSHWRVGYALAAAVSAIAAALAAAPAVRWPAALHASAAGGSAPVARAGAVPRAAVAVSLSLFALYIGIEVTAGQWSATFLEDARGVSERAAGFATSAFWAGITIGRLLLGRMLLGRGSVRTARILGIATAALLGAFLLAAVAPGPVAIVAFALAGVALAPSFPMLMATTAERVGAGMAGRVSGWQLIAGNIGGTGLAALTGLVVGLTSARAPIVVLVLSSVVGLAMVRVSAVVSVRSPRRERLAQVGDEVVGGLDADRQAHE
jgi:fucose permease